MNNIQMVDLHSQYLNDKTDFDTAIQQIINTTAFIKGPDVKTFEKELAAYLNCKHVTACANGTDALQIALMSLDLKPEDEIITTNFTFVATIEVIGLLGLTAVIADVNPNTFNIDVDKLEEKITEKTKAILPVHLFGQCADMQKIMEIAQKYNLYIIEDNAQALGSECKVNNNWRKAGTIGHIGCTSFFPSKNLGCFGDGGALMTSDDVLAEKMAMIANHGSKRKYYNDIIGVNSRLDTLQAAILRVKLPKLDAYNKARQEAAEFYNQKFKNISALQTPVCESFSAHVYHQYTLKVLNGQRDQLKEYLQGKEIPSMVYYPVPVHLQGAFKQFVQNEASNFPVTEELCKSVISLPMHTELDKEQLEYISEHVINFFS